MRKLAVVVASVLLAFPASVSAQSYYGGPPPPPRGECADHRHDPRDPCVCDHVADFYAPVAPWNIVRSGGPGVRVYGRPVVIPSGRVDIQGPPVYVEAPPIRIAAPQIYLHAPDVHVRPSEVTVEPPEIHYVGCEDGRPCPASGG